MINDTDETANSALDDNKNDKHFIVSSLQV